MWAHERSLLPTRHMCDEVSSEVLKDLTGEQYTIVAEDSVDCSTNLLQKVKCKLAKYSEDSTHTAGLENVIIIKVRCKVMLRCNIDVTLGLVNGAIDTICRVQRCVDRANKVDSSLMTIKNIALKGSPQFDKIYVIHSQFPITNAYAITIHKSQLTDIGSTVFTCGQTYVVLSRVKHIEGLRSIRALDSAVLEYNRLREEFQSNLQPFVLSK